MKKVLALILAFSMVLVFAACAGGNTDTEQTTVEETTAEAVEAPAGDVMSFEAFNAAELNTSVTVESYIQAVAYSAEYGNANLYLADETGAYYVYRMNVTEEEAATLVKGAKIKVTGIKAMWPEADGEVEISEATFELGEGNYVAEALDVTALLGTDDLVKEMNKLVSVKGAVVAAKGQDEEGNDLAYFYNWDNSGEEGADLYFDVTVGDAVYTFTVETDEVAADSETYAAVKALNVGDVIDIEAFLYWYEGANPHVTLISAAAADAEEEAETAAEEAADEAAEEAEA